jgi:hypothetical protein
MANRVTVAEVEQIIDLDSTFSDTDVTIHINAANRIVTKIVTDSSMSSDDKKECERWLAAHFCAMGRNPYANEEHAGSVSQTMGHKLDLRLDNTRWGQMAMIIDTGGDLARLNEASKKGRQLAATFTTLNP